MADLTIHDEQTRESFDVMSAEDPVREVDNPEGEYWPQGSGPNDAEWEEGKREEEAAVETGKAKVGLTYPLTVNAPVHVSILYGVQV